MTDTDAPAPKRRKLGRDFVAESLAAAASGRETPKEELMPPLPSKPPLATTERKSREERGWRWGDKHNVPPPDPVYNPADTALWPEEAAELFRATKTNSDARRASRYMRWWFDNHQMMPGRVPKIPKSAYMLYYAERKKAVYEETGKFDNKKDGRKIGKEWKALTEEQQRPYAKDIAVLRAQKESNEEWYHERLEAWRKERAERIRKEGVETDPTKRHSAGLEPFCECEKCGPIDGESPNDAGIVLGIW